MTVARAPGKVVISGAYAVLEGAPAIVAAIDRYVIADASRVASMVTPEVRAAIGDRPAPAFDADALRRKGIKLGLGSSAAIVVASLAALALAERGPLSDDDLAERVFEPALAAHRAAQGGGSGIDVAASTRGGILVALRSGDSVHARRVALPEGICVKVWASGQPVSTADMLARVRELSLREPVTHRERLRSLSDAAKIAVRAVESGEADRLVTSLVAQCRALARLGETIRAPIVTDAVRALAEAAANEGAAVLPSGAGGGDIALFVGVHPPSNALLRKARALGHVELDLSVGARGVHQSVLSVGPS